MVLGAARRSPGIYLTVEENPRKSQLGSATSHSLKIAQHVREKEKKERKGRTISPLIPTVHGTTYRLQSETLEASVGVPPAPVRVPSQGH